MADDAGLADLIASPLVTAATRAVLQERIESQAQTTPSSSSLFDAAEQATLVAVCGRLLPPDSPISAARAAAEMEARFGRSDGPGWRYDAMPADGWACRLGLAHLDAGARRHGAADFTALDAAGRDALLREAAQGAGWPGLDSHRWFEMLMVDVTRQHVPHPVVQLAMGHLGFADAAGWKAIGLGGRETWQSQPIPVAEAAGSGSKVAAATASAPTSASTSKSPASGRSPVSFGESEVVDAVVIGTGAGGGPLLWRLARAGVRVVALEAGRHWLPGHDFATDEKAQEKLFWSDERLSAGSDPIAFGSNNSGIGVGGSTLHFTAYTPRPQPDDLRLFSDFGVGCDWPLSYEELAPYFDEVEALVGVSGPTPYPWGPARKRGYPLPPLPLNAAAELMQRGCAALGIATSAAANAALSRDYAAPGMPARRACSNRGFCQAGCTTGAKGSVDVVFIPPALAAGAELRSECFGRWIERDSQGRVSGVVYLQGGKERRQKCRNVFLCGGGIETPRFLLFNEDLSNGSGQVGRNFMAHVGRQLWARFDEATHPWKGIPGGLISEDMHRPRGDDTDFAGGYLLQSIGVMPVTFAGQVARGRKLWGQPLRDYLRQFNHIAGINILGDCLPHADNFLELADEKDARGLPKPRLHFTAQENEQRMNAHAEKVMRGIWEAAGATDIWAFQRYAHVIGTARMGLSGDDAVVNANGRAFDVPNLYISDNSTFPSALSVNPALTIMALSLRTADKFLESMR